MRAGAEELRTGRLRLRAMTIADTARVLDAGGFVTFAGD